MGETEMVDEPVLSDAKSDDVLAVGIAYATPQRQVWQDLEVPNGCTVRQVIELSGILDQFPDIDIETQKVGIFGKLAKLEQAVEEGDRVEIYRPITCDP
ncbi:MAG: RnfH family protein, partial [Rhodospirillales bacterium]|nr:RnfH family protein [Rhodospirillales bacterium]